MTKAWMPFYIGDYLADTMHLTTLEHGAYLLLICHYWEHGGLPTTQKARAEITRLPYTTYRDHEMTLAVFFSHPGWRHKRIDAELAKHEKVRRTKQLAGIIGGTKTKIARHLRVIGTEAYAQSRKVAYALPTTKKDIEREKEVADEGRKEEYDWREAARALSRPGKRRE